MPLCSPVHAQRLCAHTSLGLIWDDCDKETTVSEMTGTECSFEYNINNYPFFDYKMTEMRANLLWDDLDMS